MSSVTAAGTDTRPAALFKSQSSRLGLASDKQTNKKRRGGEGESTKKSVSLPGAGPAFFITIIYGHIH